MIVVDVGAVGELNSMSSAGIILFEGQRIFFPEQFPVSQEKPSSGAKTGDSVVLGGFHAHFGIKGRVTEQNRRKFLRNYFVLNGFQLNSRHVFPRFRM